MKQLCPLILLLSLACGPEPTPEPAPPLEPPPVVLEDVSEDEETPDSSFLSDTEEVVVYYQHTHVPALVPRAKSIFKHFDQIDRIKQVIDELALAPEDGYGLSLWPPEEPFVREVFTYDQTIVVDLKAGFLNDIHLGAEQETLMVYSLVNSLLDSFDTFKNVILLFDGASAESFKGHVDVEAPLRRRDGLIVIPDEPFDERLKEEDLPLETPKLKPQEEGTN